MNYRRWFIEWNLYVGFRTFASFILAYIRRRASSDNTDTRFAVGTFQMINALTLSSDTPWECLPISSVPKYFPTIRKAFRESCGLLQAIPCPSIARSESDRRSSTVELPPRLRASHLA